MTLARMADAAFASNIPPGFDVAAGYYGGPNAYHAWPTADWGRFPGFKLPIWVGGLDGASEGHDALHELLGLVPAGSITVLDMETRKDAAYVETFGSALASEGYKVWVYGSRSTVFANPPLNGYWVADYGLTYAQVRELLALPHVRAVQDRANEPPGFDESLVKPWVEGEMWHG